jgi:redox-sensitive bicupin YhaK (pirin superfamily)
MHPHAHLIAMTVVLEGEFEDADSVGGPGPHTHTKGSLYMAQAGSGLEHMERTACDGLHSACQIIVKMRADAWNNDPAVCRTRATDIPVIPLGDSGAVARVLVGDCGDVVSPATVSGIPDMALIHVFAPAGVSSVALPIDARHERGWMVVRSGVAHVSGSGGDDHGVCTSIILTR